jgi:hypothetical protein
MMVNTHSSFITGPKAGPDTGAIVALVGEIADERRLQHDRRTDIALKGKESGNRKGAGESSRLDALKAVAY